MATALVIPEIGLGSPNLKMIKWLWSRPFKGQFVIPEIILHMANQCTKFEVFSSSSSMRYFMGTKNLQWVRDITKPLSRTVCHPYAGTYYDQPVHQIWSLYVHQRWGYEGQCKMPQIPVLWLGLIGVLQTGFVFVFVCRNWDGSGSLKVISNITIQ